MFTLNRVTTIGVGAGLVLVGCASPVGESDDPTAQASEALTEEAVTDETAEAMDEESAAIMPAGMASAFEIPNAPVPAPPNEESEPADDEDEKWLGGFGWGGLGWGGLGWGGVGLGRGLGWGGLGWGGVGVPGYGFGYASPWGYGYSRSIGYGTSFGYPGYGGFFW